MALTKIGSIGINTGIQFAGVTTIATLNASDNVLSVGGTVNFVSDVSIGGTVSIAGTLTYEDVTNVDAIGIITARSEIKVGSGITLSKDGDIFATGISTFSEGIAGDLLIDDKIVHRGDTNTAIRFADADTITAETGGSERVRIDSSGNFGVGTNNPTTKVHIQQSAVTSAPSRSSALYLENNANCEIQFVGNSSNDCQLRFGTSSNSFKGAIEYELDNNNLIHYTNGNERLRIDSDGQIGIGNIAPDTWSTGKSITIGTAQATLWGVGDQVNLSGNAYFNSGWKAAATKSGASQIQQSLGNIDFRVTGSINADAAITWTDALRIASSGELLVNTTTTSPHIRLSQKLGVVHVGSYGGVSLTNYGGTTAAHKPLLDFNRTRGTSNASMTAVAAGDGLGHIVFRGADGTNFIDSAGIRADVDDYNSASPGTTDMPGRLVFETTPDGSTTLAERLRITHTGALQITSPSAIYPGAQPGEIQWWNEKISK